MNNKPTLLLHIGTEKTGTTSIQEFLAFNRAQLAQNGILYPRSLGEKNHIKLAAYAEHAPWPFASQNLGIDTPEKHQDFCLNLRQQLGQELAAHDYRHAIISNEHLHSNIKTQDQIQAVKDFLDAFFSDIQVLVYFRRQDLMAVSLHSTALLVGYTPTRQLDINAAKNYYYDFNAIYDNWAGVFGSDNITARVFARDRFISGNVITDFCAMSGLNGQAGLVMTERKNESLSLEAACLIHELNGRIKEGSVTFAKPLQKRQLIERITTQCKGPSHYPGRDLAKQFYQVCSASNAALEQRLGIKLFDDDFSMYPEHENTALYEEKRLWAKTALDDFMVSPSPPSQTALPPPTVKKQAKKNLKLGIVGNPPALADALSGLNGVASALSVPINLYGTKRFAKADDAFKNLIQDPEAVVLSVVCDPKFNEYETTTLKKTLAHVHTLTKLSFSGLHPDAIRLGNESRHIPSVLGEYHSKIILHSFLSGLPQAACRARFCADEYERLGYFQAFAKAATSLRKNDQGLDIRVAEAFLGMIQHTPALHAPHYPTAAAIQEMSLKIASFLGLAAWRYPIGFLDYKNTSGAWWPVYNEIAEKHGLKYRTPQIFRHSPSLGGKPIGLDELIATSYKHYQTIQELLQKNPRVQKLLTETR
jgi:hypothetical protein